VSDAKIGILICASIALVCALGVLGLAFWFDWRVGAALILCEIRDTARTLSKRYARAEAGNGSTGHTAPPQAPVGPGQAEAP
jgi:hypothetical protein